MGVWLIERSQTQAGGAIIIIILLFFIPDIDKLKEWKDLCRSIGSVTSFTIDQLEDEALELELDLDFDNAPHDVYAEHESVGGRIVVAKAGVALPLITNYKRKVPGTVPVR